MTLYNLIIIGIMPSGQKVIGILGGGISGLSTAFYLRKKFGDGIKAVIFEKSSRCGGWIKTISRTDGSDSFHYEMGDLKIQIVIL